MKKYCIYFISLIVFVIFLDKGFGELYDWLYFSERSQNNDRLIHSAIGTNEDILIFGSSRAYHHYNPKIFEDSLKMSCYNVGYGGQNIYFHIALLKSALTRHVPKIVILDLFYIDFEQTSSSNDFEKLGVLLPFSGKSPIFYNTVLQRSWNEKVKLLSSIYPLNSKQLYMVRNNLFSVRSDYKGFAGLNKTWHKHIQVSENNKEVIVDSLKYRALGEFIDLCIQNRIKIYVGVSPIYSYNSNQYYTKILSNLQDRYSIITYNFEMDSLFLKNRDFFADIVHLNRKGADVFSEKIIQLIKGENLN